MCSRLPGTGYSLGSGHEFQGVSLCLYGTSRRVYGMCKLFIGMPRYGYYGIPGKSKCSKLGQMGELKLMEGNEAIAEAAIRAGVDAYFGYPITPQSEIMEYLAEEYPHRRKDMVVLQAESEIAAINMVYGAASTGKKAMTSSSSPGISLKQEGISYLAGAELPCLIVNVVRGGPGLGTIQPSQADYFQAGRLLPGYQGRRAWRLPPDCAGAGFGAGNGRLCKSGFRTGV